MTCGIYMLSWPETHKVYIGKSKHIEIRFMDHLYHMKKGTNCPKLNEAYNLYGKPSIEIMVECLESELSANEDVHIKLWNAVDDGFNTLYKSDDIPTPDNSGEKHGMSKYTNDQISEAFLCIVNNPTLRLSNIADLVGMPRSVIGHISSGNRHLWLKDKYPEEFSTLLSIKGTRSTTNMGQAHGGSLYSSDQILNAYKLLGGTPLLSYKEVHMQTGVSVAVIKQIVYGTTHKYLQEQYPDTWSNIKNCIKMANRPISKL